MNRSAEIPVSFDASMYFRFGKSARMGLRAKTCFEAVLTGERTSTTRFEEDSRAQYEHWKQVRAGSLVRIWSGPWKNDSFTGRSCIIEITEAPRAIDLTEIGREAWSKAEGWAPEFLDVLLNDGKRFGLQIFYRLHTPPQDPQGELLLG